MSKGLVRGNHRASSLCQSEQSPCGEGAKGSREFVARKVALKCTCKVFMCQDLASHKSGFKNEMKAKHTLCMLPRCHLQAACYKTVFTDWDKEEECSLSSLIPWLQQLGLEGNSKSAKCLLRVGQTAVSLEAWSPAPLLGIAWPIPTRASGHGHGPFTHTGQWFMLELPLVFELVGFHTREGIRHHRASLPREHGVTLACVHEDGMSSTVVGLGVLCQCWTSEIPFSQRSWRPCLLETISAAGQGHRAVSLLNSI